MNEATRLTRAYIRLPRPGASKHKTTVEYRPLWTAITAVVAALAFTLGYTLSTSADPRQFVPVVQDAYPETDGRAEDVLGYGYAVCAGLDDGRTEAQVAGWLAGTPHEALGIDGSASEFGLHVVELATELLCVER